MIQHGRASLSRPHFPPLKHHNLQSILFFNFADNTPASLILSPGRRGIIKNFFLYMPRNNTTAGHTQPSVHILIGGGGGNHLLHPAGCLLYKQHPLNESQSAHVVSIQPITLINSDPYHNPVLCDAAAATASLEQAKDGLSSTITPLIDDHFPNALT